MWRTAIIMCSGTAWLLTAGVSAFPPLTDQQTVRLETAHDGRDHREEAFIALVENMRAWDGEMGDTPVRLQPDIDAMLDDPDRFRGEIVRLAGRIAQMTALPTPHEGVLECFVRDEDNRPLLAYIVTDAIGDPMSRVREGSRIELFARFYKRVDLTARDGQVRSYAAFVGAHPRIISPSAAQTEVTHLAVITIALLALLVVFVLLIMAVRRQRSSRDRPASRRLNVEAIPPELDDTANLPDDPAEALSELRRRMNHADS